MSHATPDKAAVVDAQPPSSAGGGGAGGGGGLVRVTVNLTPRAFGALQRSCQRTGDSKTDTINRALVTYALLQDLAAEGGGTLTFLNANGERERVHIV